MLSVWWQIWWFADASCISQDTKLWQNAARVRDDARVQWFVLVVNLVNVFSLMAEDTACDPGECDDVYQDIVLPTLNIIAQITFTVDMVKLPH